MVGYPRDLSTRFDPPRHSTGQGKATRDRRGRFGMNTLHAANLGLRFLLELCMLAALGYWGFQAGDGPVLKIVLGLGAPLLAAVVWGLFIAPRAIRPVRELV